ncbi:MAG TPA: hypothetical protein VFS60_07055 [Thermoanaerobaculia bacterium]|nr:hypothetical protein [Thermoanaerobaculia bacterium]
MLTKLLERAFEEAAKLPAGDQDCLAEWLLAEIESEERWSRQFAASSDQLAELARRALAEHASGETEDLNANEV